MAFVKVDRTVHCESIWDLAPDGATACGAISSHAPIETRRFVFSVKHPALAEHICKACVDAIKKLID